MNAIDRRSIVWGDENLGPFVAMALALIATGHAGGLGAVGATIWMSPASYISQSM